MKNHFLTQDIHTDKILTLLLPSPAKKWPWTEAGGGRCAGLSPSSIQRGLSRSSGSCTQQRHRIRGCDVHFNTGTHLNTHPATPVAFSVNLHVGTYKGFPKSEQSATATALQCWHSSEPCPNRKLPYITSLILRNFFFLFFHFVPVALEQYTFEMNRNPLK